MQEATMIRRLALLFVASLSLALISATSVLGAEVDTKTQTTKPSTRASARKSDKSSEQTAATNGPAIAGDKTNDNGAISASTAELKTAERPIQLHPIDRKSIPTGCGCGFFLPTAARDEGPMLLHVDGSGQATMKLDGQAMQLQRIEERLVRQRRDGFAAGDRVLMTFRGEFAQASLNGTVERNCMPAEDNCSRVTYQSMLTISKDGRKRQQQTWGYCGCDAQVR